MNKVESDILLALSNEFYINQRILAQKSGYSLGLVNRSLKKLQAKGYLNPKMHLTEKAKEQILSNSPKNAVILAAGFGMRMVPINMETTKGLLTVHGEVLIERIIRQLHEVDIYEIYIVVGFMKEQYEYLIDEYHVKLLVNPEYATKNNLHSLKRVLHLLSNTYIIPCDIWCVKNPFRKHELYSWYMVSSQADVSSPVRVTRTRELVFVPDSSNGNLMVGIAYLGEKQAAMVRERISVLCKDRRFDKAFWEEALYQKKDMLVPARVVSTADVIEINTYEQLRELDEHSDQLKSEAIDVISEALHATAHDITHIAMLKKGMTNRSFLFECKNAKYIMRIPGEGTGHLINREKEAAVYQAIEGKGICDDVIYINPTNGYKITRFLEYARVCDPFDQKDVSLCMKKLREFHEQNLSTDHKFHLFEQIQFYESLWPTAESIYKDYLTTKQHVFSLKNYIESHVESFCLTHIDAVPDNFLFLDERYEQDSVRLIDWEYAGMQDPHVDIAMFCIYSLYDRTHVDQLIRYYFPEGCSDEIRIKIYCYIAVCGLLWSNWCEYKRHLGIDFGEYSLRQYRYAKEYYKIVREEWAVKGEACIK